MVGLKPGGRAGGWPDRAATPVFPRFVKILRMSQLLEVEQAVDDLPLEEKQELCRFLASRLRAAGKPAQTATLAEGPNGTLLLVTPSGSLQ